jgi:choline dehydrogenase-like flavoprotein
MIIDARSIEDGAEIDCDVCIVGAGPAGITVARELDESGVRVCMLESGGPSPEPRTQELNDGESVGGRYKASGVEAGDTVGFSRVRVLGGTTNHWGGWCRPLDPIDFDERPGVPDSGWPIRRDELEPHYARAQAVCRLGPASYDAAHWARRSGARLLPVARPVVSEVYQLSAPRRFGDIYRGALMRSRRIRVLLHANVVNIAADADAGRIERVRAATLTGTRFEVRARRFVLAAGGIENARLLLASNDVRPGGIGNGHDLVGRYFADHPHTLIGHVAGPLAPQLAFYRFHPVAGTTVRGALTTAEGFVRSEGLLRFSLTIEKLRPEPLPPLTDGVLDLLRATGGTDRELDTALYMRAEMAPNRDSRVTLSDKDRDALGMPRVRVDWRLGDLDIASIKRSLDAVAQAFGRGGVGRVYRTFAHDDSLSEALIGGSHHMGTTRMHGDPRRGVVDADCRVHGISNLFVAGSSVFPTVGFSNPTLTIVALALRLAERLGRR